MGPPTFYKPKFIDSIGSPGHDALVLVLADALCACPRRFCMSADWGSMGCSCIAGLPSSCDMRSPCGAAGIVGGYAFDAVGAMWVAARGSGMGKVVGCAVGVGILWGCGTEIIPRVLADRLPDGCTASWFRGIGVWNTSAKSGGAPPERRATEARSSPQLGAPCGMYAAR